MDADARLRKKEEDTAAEAKVEEDARLEGERVLRCVVMLEGEGYNVLSFFEAFFKTKVTHRRRGAFTKAKGASRVSVAMKESTVMLQAEVEAEALEVARKTFARELRGLEKSQYYSPMKATASEVEGWTWDKTSREFETSAPFAYSLLSSIHQRGDFTPIVSIFSLSRTRLLS